MIDESILDEIIPVPDADAKMQELKEELAAEGFTITKWGSGGVFYWLTTYLCADTHRAARLARTIPE